MSLQDVLIVDDSPNWRRTLQRILEAEGYRVTLASNIETALHELRGKYFPVVVVDVRLQGESDDEGLRLLQDIDDIWPAPLVAKIIISGYVFSPSEMHAFSHTLKAQSTSFVAKGGESGQGLDRDEFLKAVGLVLSQLPKNVHAAAGLFRAWTNALTSAEHRHAPNFVTHVIEVAEQFEKALDLVPVARRTAFVYRDIVAVTLDCSPIFVDTRVPAMIPVLFVHHQHLEEADIEDIRYVLEDRLESWVALVCHWTDNDRHLIGSYVARLQAHGLSIALVGKSDVETVVGSEDPHNAMRRLVLPSVDLTTVSPFTITGPTPNRLFFGREKELRELVVHATTSSYAVIGGRRIGKTSILAQLHRVRLPAAGYYSVFHVCTGDTPTYEAFLDWQLCDWSPSPPPNVPSTFGDLFQVLPLDVPVVLLLDEADRFVPKDNTEDWRLFDRLRSLANSGRVQVILSGEHILRNAMRNPATPLFNLANEVLLPPLDFGAVQELVTRPMKMLEIALVDESAIVRNIYAFTSGHPNIVQRLCQRLIERLNAENLRRVTVDDVKAIAEDPGFQREDFLRTYWDTATPLEKIISLLMADNENARSMRSVRDSLAERCKMRPRAREVDDALQRLVDLRSILKRTRDGYEFAAEAFPRVVAHTIVLADMLDILVEDYQQEVG